MFELKGLKIAEVKENSNGETWIRVEREDGLEPIKILSQIEFAWIRQNFYDLGYEDSKKGFKKRTLA
jgi:hypothetical protein